MDTKSVTTFYTFDTTRKTFIITHPAYNIIGATLLQEVTPSSGVVIAQISTFLSNIVLNPDSRARFTPIDLELLGITLAVKIFRSCILGRPIDIYTDSPPEALLPSINRNRNTDGFLAQYNFELKHTSECPAIVSFTQM
jgi:hypothetical protein